MIIVMLPSARCVAQDYSGQWLGTITESVNRCERLGKAEPGDYKLTIIQKDNDIAIMENVVQRPYNGTLDPGRPGEVQVSGAYNDDGGYVTELVDIEFENDSKGAGRSVWYWSDGLHGCGGHFQFELKKIRP
jgi:hypothetical protein